MRELKLIGVEVFFENELLSSFDPKCEMLLSTLASLAQEESHNLSENIKWGILRKMENGDFTLPYARFLGYRKGQDGRPEIIPKEARVVQRIYWLYLNGVPINRIATILTKKKAPVLVPMQSALNAWKIPTFADCFLIYAYLCYLKISDAKT